MRLTLKHVQRRSNGSFRYRRVVPEYLRAIIGKGEIVHPMGNSEKEVLRTYSSVHTSAEKLLAEARRLTRSPMIANAASGTPLEAHGRLLARLANAGVSPTLEGLGADQDEGTVPGEIMQRALLAEGVLDAYPINPETGSPMGVSADDGAFAKALFNGAPPSPVPTLSDALHLYLKDRVSPTATKARQRVGRVIGYAQTALGGDLKLTDIRRTGVLKIREYLMNRPGNVPATAKRNLAGIRAVIEYSNWTYQQHEAAQVTLAVNDGPA